MPTLFRVVSISKNSFSENLGFSKKPVFLRKRLFKQNFLSKIFLTRIFCDIIVEEHRFNVFPTFFCTLDDYITSKFNFYQKQVKIWKMKLFRKSHFSQKICIIPPYIRPTFVKLMISSTIWNSSFFEKPVRAYTRRGLLF